MEALELARWQFAITTLYHFVLVPLTIGLAPIVAGFQTAWVVTKNERWLRLTKFFGKLLLINFALGVATGGPPPPPPSSPSRTSCSPSAPSRPRPPPSRR